MGFLNESGLELLWQHIIAKLGSKADISDLENGDIVVGKAVQASNADNAVDATYAVQATQDAAGNVITETYLTKDGISSEIDKAKAYTDSEIEKIADVIEEKDGEISALRDALNDKLDADDLSEHLNADNPHGLTAEDVDALPISGGTLTGILYTDASTPLFIGKSGKVGMRASTTSKSNVGQINISNAWYENGNKWGSQISAYNGDEDAYNEFRVSHNGLEYNCQDGNTYQVIHQGNLEDIVTPSSIGAQPAGSYAAEEHGHDEYYEKTEIDSKISIINTAISKKADDTHDHNLVSDTSNGFMSIADKAKLDSMTPELYAKSIGLFVNEDGDAMITWDNHVLPVEGVEF